MKNEISDAVGTTLDGISSTISSLGEEIVEVARTAFEAGESVSQSISNAFASTTLLVGDLNGDGKVDIEDAKIAIEKAKDVASSVVDESAKLGKEVMESELVKDVAPYAAIGAAIAIPIPFVGSALGAALGAGLGLYKNATKKN